MGIYVITGATSGIGAKTAEILRERGHEVVNIDLNGGDINANPATKEGRAGAIAEPCTSASRRHRRHDLQRGRVGRQGAHLMIISLNYFGATEMARGVFDLLRRRAAARGNVVQLHRPGRGAWTWPAC